MSSELLYGPFQSVVFWHVDRISCWADEVWVLYVLWYWNENINIVSDTSLLVITLDLDQEPDFSAWWLFNDNVNWEQWLDSNVESVTHKLKLYIWWDKSYQSFILELAQADALMELDIVKFDCFAFWGPALSLVVGLVIESQFKVGHAWELAIGIDNTNNLWLDDVIWRANEHVKFFDYV